MNLEHIGKCVIIKFMPNKGEAGGFYDEENGRIYLNARLPLLEREVVYYHELTHKEHCQSKCFCWKSDYWCECHAMRGELQRVIARKSKRLSRAYYQNERRAIKKYNADPKVWKVHIKAFNRLRKTKMYKRHKAIYETTVPPAD